MNYNELRRLATDIADQVVSAGVTSFSNVEELDRYIDDALMDVEDVEDSSREQLFIETRKRLEHRLTEF